MSVISGGAKLEKYLRETAKRVSNAATLHVGFLENATYPDGTSVALVAAVQNFGSAAQGIPGRPYFSDMIADKSPEWPAALGQVLKATDYDATAALNLMGEEIKGELQESIIDFSGVPLSPQTIAAKGNDKQLVESAHMLNSVDYAVDPAE